MEYLAVALWSINERLAGRPGADLEPLGNQWAGDLLLLAYEQRKALKELRNS